MRRTIAAATVTASLLGGGAAGAALFAPALAGAQSPTDDTIDQNAGQNAASRRAGWFRSALDDLVEQGTITAEQADAVAGALAEAAPDRNRRGHFRLDAVAEALELSAEDLRNALAGGDTLADIAAATGSGAEELVATLLARVEDRLAERVADGALSQERADELTAEATERITAVVGGELPLEGFDDRGGRRHGRWSSWAGAGAGDPTGDEAA